MVKSSYCFPVSPPKNLCCPRFHFFSLRESWTERSNQLPANWSTPTPGDSDDRATTNVFLCTGQVEREPFKREFWGRNLKTIDRQMELGPRMPYFYYLFSIQLLECSFRFLLFCFPNQTQISSMVKYNCTRQYKAGPLLTLLLVHF